MVNLEIRKFKESIIAITNASPLPIEVKRMVFNEIGQAINEAANNAIMSEQQEAEKQKVEQEENEEE